jgi:beta-lactamase regulating signal transducer with metallopeptidase domain
MKETTMTRLNSWLSADVMHALGWALIHSLWQGLGVAALAMLAMAFCRQPSVRYVIGVAALAAMLAAPVATFLVLIRPVGPVSALPAISNSVGPADRVMLAQARAYPGVASADRVIAAVAEAPSRLPNLLPWLVGAWACGVAVFSLRFAGGFLLLEHRRRTQSHSPGERVLALCREMQRQLGLDRAIQYLECGWVQAPAVIGWLRPAVLLPVFALTGLSEEQFRAVIAHELAHIRRHDWLVNLFQVLAETLLFYHPAMWWLNRRVRIERELCCDEIAVALTGSRLEYARALTQMAEWKNVSMLAMAANRGPLTQRILHILGRGAPGAGQRVAGLTGGMLFLCAALAAANLLFGIAYPVQMAEAKESVKTALVSSQIAVADLARNVVLTAKDAAPPTVAPDQIDATADSQAGNLAVPSPDLTRLLPNQSLAMPTMVASDAAPAATPRDQAVASDGSATTPALANAGSEGPQTIYACHYVNPVWGRVVSPEAIQMTGFHCSFGYLGGVGYGSCPNWRANPNADVGSLTRAARTDLSACKFDVMMNVHLADPADAGKMQPGRIVSLAGDFRVEIKNRKPYIYVTNAKVLYLDPFDRHAEVDQPAPTVVASNAPVTTPRNQPVTLASAAAPRPGEMVGPAGDFHITRRDSADHVSFAALQSASPARGRAELALRCWLGLVEYKGCWKDNGCNFGMGPVEKVEYLGGTAAGADAYQVRYRFQIAAYTVAPDPKGKTDDYLVKPTDHYWVKREISPPAAPILIYTRPEDAPPAGCIYGGGDPGDPGAGAAAVQQGVNPQPQQGSAITP